ncbi:MAG: ribonuclease P protein component [Phycisphaerae bacterium]
MTSRASKKYRLKRRKDIDRVFSHGTRANDNLLTLVAAANELGYARVGVGASLRHGSAVRRNRVKRLAREAFRLVRDELPAGYDYMLIPRPGADISLEGLKRSLPSLARRACGEQERA